LTLRPGIGLLLVNVGYVAVLSFGAAASSAYGLHVAGIIVSLFGVGVIVSRTLLARISDRWGGPRTLTVAALAEAAELAALGLAGSTGLALSALVVLSIGQGLAVPARRKARLPVASGWRV
jgi:MFS family permease